MLWDLKVNEDLLGIKSKTKQNKTRRTTGGQKKGFGYNKAYWDAFLICYSTTVQVFCLSKLNFPWWQKKGSRLLASFSYVSTLARTYLHW